MTPRQALQRILSSEPAHRIRFEFPRQKGDGQFVSAATFARVLTAINGGEIFVRYMTGSATIPPFYAMSKRTIFLPKQMGRREEGFALGACLDAFMHLVHAHLTANDQDAMRKVVNVLYFRMAGLGHSHWSHGFAAAGKVAEALLHVYQRGNEQFPKVDPKLWANLKMAVMSDPANNDEGFHMKSGIIGTSQGLEWDENDTVSM